MDARQRWDALHVELGAAQTAIEAGERIKALEHVDAALAIDPNFVAAHWLRDQLMASTGSSSVTNDRARAVTIVDAPQRSDKPGLTSTIAYATGFEERVRRRRVERRIDAAQAALEHGRLGDAQAAINELIALDPGLPELSQLTTLLEEIRRPAVAPARRGWWLAAAVFVLTVFGLWDRGAPTGGGRPVVTSASSSAESTTGQAELSTVDQRTDADAGQTSAPLAPRGPIPGSLGGKVEKVEKVLPPQQLVVPPRPLEERPAIPAVAVMAAPAAPPPPSLPVVPAVPAVNDERLVEQALQRYRSAYEGLDAQSAHAVYPAVNEVALARAFEGLVSQSLIFDACDIQLLGGSATATCHGTARYVAKVGKREPVTEPRLWSFTLRKGAEEWTIERARTER